MNRIRRGGDIDMIAPSTVAPAPHLPDIVHLPSACRIEDASVLRPSNCIHAEAVWIIWRVRLEEPSQVRSRQNHHVMFEGVSNSDAGTIRRKSDLIRMVTFPIKPNNRSCVLVSGIEPNESIIRCCHQPAGPVEVRTVTAVSILRIARQ